MGQSFRFGKTKRIEVKKKVDTKLTLRLCPRLHTMNAFMGRLTRSDSFLLLAEWLLLWLECVELCEFWLLLLWWWWWELNAFAELVWWWPVDPLDPPPPPPPPLPVCELGVDVGVGGVITDNGGWVTDDVVWWWWLNAFRSWGSIVWCDGKPNV